MPFLHWLDHLDRTLFMLVQHASFPVLDTMMPFLRAPLTWAPLYAFMLYYAFRFGRQRAFAFILLSVVTVAITDSLTAQVLKPLFARPRPCHDAAMQACLRGLVDCGGLYSMPSNHAANHFGLASFWYFAIRSLNGRKWGWLWLWAAIICYAQVYVGKHYPFDVGVGAIVGTLTGLAMYRLFRYWMRRQGHRSPMQEGKTSYI